MSEFINAPDLQALAAQSGAEADTREGFEGLIIGPEKLTEVAESLRDEAGFNYLASLTAVDWPDADEIEVVYALYRVPEGGPGMRLKVRTPRDAARVPSVARIWPSANFQEREAYDLMGVHFTGHPNLKRILLWEGFEGHPLRKDWREPYYEAEKKPFASRHPDGKFSRAEQRSPYGMNVQYPEGFNPGDDWRPIADEGFYAGLGVEVFEEAGSGDLRTDRVLINIGPHHPSTHGVFRMIAKLDGENVADLEPVMGYLHRCHEKIGERNTYLGNMPYTDRLDYVCAMSNNIAYAMAVEKLADLEVPERAGLLRVLMAELTRVMNHTFAIGFLLNDMGAFYTPMMYAANEREFVLDFFEAVAGSRMMPNYCRFGGVSHDLPDRIKGVPLLANDKVRDEETAHYLHELIHERLPRLLDMLDDYLTQNEIVMARTQGVGILPPDRAIALGVSGPVLRASGVPYDVRRAEGYGLYDRFDWDVPVYHNGDVYDRYLIRLAESWESVRILRQALPLLEATAGEPILPKHAHRFKPPAGEVYGRAENPKGELGFYIVSDGTPNPHRYHVRSPSFVNMGAMAEMCKGHKIADVVAILGSLDIVVGELDR